MENKKHFGKLSARGFTIIELIVVVAIISVLATIVMVNVSKYSMEAKIAAVRANMKQLLTMSTTFQTDSSINFSSMGFAYFCSDPNYGGKITQAINKLNIPDFDYACYDYVNNGGPCDYYSSDDGSTKWYAYYYNGADSTYYCVDSSGNPTDNEGDYDTCSCQ